MAIFCMDVIRIGQCLRGGFLGVLLFASTAWGQSPSIAVIDSETARQSVQWLSEKFVAAAPRTFSGQDGWGDTKSVWSGIKFERDGWKIDTQRRKREVRHGRWVQYEISLPDPAPPNLSMLTIESVVPVMDRSSSSGAMVSLDYKPASIDRWLTKSRLQTPANFRVRVERWNLGLKLMSVEITGSMVIGLQVESTLAMYNDFSEVPPAIALDVKVQSASLEVTSFEVHRISKIGGDVAEELGDLAQETILKIWLRKENDRLADRLNRAIEKKRGDLRWSWVDWIGRASVPSPSTASPAAKP